MKLLALIIAFGLYNYVGKAPIFRSFFWLDYLFAKLKMLLPSERIQWFLVVLIPVLSLWVLLDWLFEMKLDSVNYLVTHVAILYYCLGPTTIAADLKNQTLVEKLNLGRDSKPSQRVYALTDAALRRWFGVFFWYVVLGVYGALAYRVCCHLVTDIKPPSATAMKLLKLIEFPVTILMTVSLALASDFDKIWKHCKQYLTRETMLSFDSLFLYKSMDFAVEQCEIETKDISKDQAIELTAFTVLKRMLIVWLVFVALLVLFSKG